MDNFCPQVTPEDLARASADDVRSFKSVSWAVAIESIKKLQSIGVDPAKFRKIFPHGEAWLGADFGYARELGSEVYAEVLKLFATTCDAQDCERELASRERPN